MSLAIPKLVKLTATMNHHIRLPVGFVGIHRSQAVHLFCFVLTSPPASHTCSPVLQVLSSPPLHPPTEPDDNVIYLGDLVLACPLARVHRIFGSLFLVLLFSVQIPLSQSVFPGHSICSCPPEPAILWEPTMANILCSSPC